MKKSIKKIISMTILSTICSLSYSNIFFSGFTGAKVNLSASQNNSTFNPIGNIEAYMSGQINLSQDILIRGEFSVKTADLIDTSIFTSTKANTDFNSLFQIDELSINLRRNLLDSTNYISLFAGTYEPIGSDVFLRRQFGIQPVASRLMENWLGLSSSVIFPLFGVGLSDVIHFAKQPMCLGIYAYVNKELEDVDVLSLNIDARYAGVYRFFTYDIDAGLGFPLRTSNQDDAFLVVKSVYWRAGFNFLIGNNYTPAALFMQGGIYSESFNRRGIADGSYSLNGIFSECYALIEPRFRLRNCQIHTAIFNLPSDTANNIMYIDNGNEKRGATCGINIDVFTDTLYIKNKSFIFGIASSMCFPGVNFSYLFTPDIFLQQTFNAKTDGTPNPNYSVMITPYLSTKLYNGDLNVAFQVSVSDLIKKKIWDAFKVSIGYKTQI